MRKIGLKLANGEFYPVLDDVPDSSMGEVPKARKRLVVTTVQDGQSSVQIDIYRGVGPTVAAGEYVGSLVIDGIPFAPKGEPDIRLDLGLDAEGKLSAYAEDLATGEHRSLELALLKSGEAENYEIPDFAFEEEEAPAEAFGGSSSLLRKASARNAELEDMASPEETEALTGDFGSEESPFADSEASGPEFGEEAPRRKSRLPLVAFAFAALLLVLGGAWLVYHFFLAPKSATVELTAEPVSPVAPAPEAVAPALPEPAAQIGTLRTPPPAAPQAVAEAPATSVAPAAAPAPSPAPEAPSAAPAPALASAPVTPKANAPKSPGVYYKLRWGDTLWDLAYTYYRNPWLFGKIAKANKIKNPDHIIAGKKIWIPPRD